jgi:hypothetical protein
MSDDWLWDRSGPPDAEIERLEQTLAPLRYRHRAPTPAFQPAPKRVWVAAAVMVAAAAALIVATAIPRPVDTPWQIAGAKVHQGEVLRTGAAGIRLEASAVGQVDIAPNSELRAVVGRRLSLKHGQLHAYIWAPPGQFVVDTPSARATDLGCEYTLNVDSAGDGLLKVSMGWVAFSVNGRESFIPAQAQCRTRKKHGPGLPYYEDASPALRDSVEAFDRGDRSALRTILASARERDGLTVWHLLTRTSGDDRGAVYDRLAELVPMLPGSSREAVVRGEPDAIDRCWDALGLENTDWWRRWERRW